MGTKGTHPLLLLQTALEVQQDNDVEDFCHLCVMESGRRVRAYFGLKVCEATCLGEAKLFLLPAPDIPSDARIAEVGDRESTQSPTLDSSWSSRKTCIKEEFRPLEMRLD